MINVLIIDPNGTGRIEHIDKVYPGINQAIGVQWIEGIYTPGLAYYLDEEGKMNGRNFNPMAQMLFQENGGQLLPGDFLVGPVAIVNAATPEGGSTPQWVIDKAKEMGVEIVEG